MRDRSRSGDQPMPDILQTALSVHMAAMYTGDLSDEQLSEALIILHDRLMFWKPSRAEAERFDEAVRTLVRIALYEGQMLEARRRAP